MVDKPSREDLISRAAYAMNVFYERANELYHDVARSLGLSDSAFDILYALYSEDGQRQSELCKTSMMPKQTLASSVRKLEEQGLVRVKNGSSSRLRAVNAQIRQSLRSCKQKSML